MSSIKNKINFHRIVVSIILFSITCKPHALSQQDATTLRRSYCTTSNTTDNNCFLSTTTQGTVRTDVLAVLSHSCQWKGGEEESVLWYRSVFISRYPCTAFSLSLIYQQRCIPQRYEVVSSRPHSVVIAYVITIPFQIKTDPA